MQWKDYFAKQTWYKVNPAYADTLLSAEAKRNVALLSDMAAKGVACISRAIGGVMPIFTQGEYDDTDPRPSLDEAWDRLPISRRIAGLRVRWLGPLVDLGHDDWLGDLSEAAWGYLEDCGWQRALDETGAMLDARGRVRPRWAAGLRAGAARLAEAGGRAGPEGDLDRRASWLCFALAEPRAVIKASAAKRGWDR